MCTKKLKNDFQIYLQPGFFINSNSPRVVSFTQSICHQTENEIEKGVKLYYAVRDLIRYNPYGINFEPEKYKASWILEKKVGFCIQKAILLAAAARAAGIPSRLGFSDVRNHLATERLKMLMKTDIFIYHGYCELFLEGKWIKTTPAFNQKLCKRFKVKPLEFDGKNDSIFHPFDINGNKHMDYIKDHGIFADFPLQKMEQAFKEGYPHLYTEDNIGWPLKGNFELEARQER